MKIRNKLFLIISRYDRYYITMVLNSRDKNAAYKLTTFTYIHQNITVSAEFSAHTLGTFT